ASLPPAATAPNTSKARGATPTYAGLELAYNHLKDSNAVDTSLPAFVILVTDGAANCDPTVGGSGTNCNSAGNRLIQTYDTRLEAFVDAANISDGIPTFVVGIDTTEGLLTCEPPESELFCPDPWKENPDECTDFNSIIEPYEKLDALALAGGRPQPPGGPRF